MVRNGPIGSPAWVAALAALALAAPDAKADEPGVAEAVARPSDAERERRDRAALERVGDLLRDIESAGREERMGRWSRICDLMESSPAVERRLREIAEGGDVTATRYQRFVAAGQVAGFGEPTSQGPDHIAEGTPLGLYVEIHRGLRFRGRRWDRAAPKKIDVDPRLREMKVGIPANEWDDLRFQEILWELIRKYDLWFRTMPDGTFRIVAGQPLA